jgi:hypothetical protein
LISGMAKPRLSAAVTIAPSKNRAD